MKIHLSLLALTLSAASQAATKLPRPLFEKIEAGPELAWFVSPKLPLVDFVLAFPGGTRFDPDGKSGTAALLSEMMEHDSALSEAEKLGGTLAVSVSEERTLISAHGLAEDGEELLRLALRLARAPKLESPLFEREKKRMLERWDRLGDSVPLLANFLFSRLISSGTPYGRGGALSPREGEAITLSDVRSFHARRFVADGALFLGVGDMRVDRLRTLVLAAMKEWGRKTQSDLSGKTWAITSPVLPASGTTWIINRSGASQTEIRMGFPAPSYSSPDREALSVANALIGETFTSRLLSELRDRKGLVYGISSGFSHEIKASNFWIQTATQSVTTIQAMEGIEKIWEGLTQEPPTDAEVEAAKEYLVGYYPVTTRTLSAVASRWMTLREFGLPEDYLDSFEERIRKVTTAEVRAAISKHLVGQAWTKVLAGDSKILLPLLRVSGAKIKQVSASDLRSLRASSSGSRSSALPKRHPPRSQAKGP